MYMGNISFYGVWGGAYGEVVTNPKPYALNPAMTVKTQLHKQRSLARGGFATSCDLRWGCEERQHATRRVMEHGSRFGWSTVVPESAMELWKNKRRSCLWGV